MKRIGIFGGTFDPVHNGHLQMAVEARQLLDLDEVRLVPCHYPPHRSAPMLDSQQRLRLLSLAVEGKQGLLVDDSELRRDCLSYTVETLAAFRQQFEADSLVLMLGADAFAQLPSWHQWQRLRELAHIVVMARPGSGEPASPDLRQWVVNADSVDIIQQQTAGGFVMLEQRLSPVSATGIRQQLMNNEEVTDIPQAVADYIKQQHLYQNTNQSQQQEK